MIEKETVHTFVLTIDRTSLDSLAKKVGKENLEGEIFALLVFMGFSGEDSKSLRYTEEGIYINRKSIR